MPYQGLSILLTFILELTELINHSTRLGYANSLAILTPEPCEKPTVVSSWWESITEAIYLFLAREEKC